MTGVTLGAAEATGHVPLSDQSHFVDEDVNSVRQQGTGGGVGGGSLW